MSKLTLQGPSVATFKKDDKEKRTFKMTGYAGSVMDSGMGKIVIDLAGMKFRNEVTPIFQHHDSRRIVGHATPEVVDGKLELNGVISGTEEAAQEVINTSDNGFPWQASVGISIFDVNQVKKDDEVEVNGMKLNGPIVVLSDTELFETSFVPLGRDSQTSAVVLSEDFDLELFQTQPKGDMEMEQEKVKETSVKVEACNLSELRAEFGAEKACDYFEQGLTLEQAKLAHYEELKDENKRLDEELKNVIKCANDSAGAEPVEHVEDKIAEDQELSLEEKRDAQLQKYEDAGLEPLEAYEKLAKEHEELCI
jgi:hypothetical protein